MSHIATDVVTVVCPIWCVRDEVFHRGELLTEDGVIHHSADFGVAPDDNYALTKIAHPDGTPMPEEASHADVMVITGNGTLLHPDDLEKHAQALLDMVKVARTSARSVSSVVCPPWCRYTQEDHLTEVNLTGDGVHVVHESVQVEGDLWLHARARYDGTPAPLSDDENGVHDPVMFASSAGDFYTVDEVREREEALRNLALQSLDDRWLVQGVRS